MKLYFLYFNNSYKLKTSASKTRPGLFYSSGYVVNYNDFIFCERGCLKCHCIGKIVDLILIATEQHFRTRLNDAFSFAVSCFVSEIVRFLQHAN